MIDAHECGYVHACACVNACLHLFPESPGLSTGQGGERAALLIPSLLPCRAAALTGCSSLGPTFCPTPPALFDLLFSFWHLFPVLLSNTHLSDSFSCPSYSRESENGHYSPWRTPDISPRCVLPTVTMT